METMSTTYGLPTQTQPSAAHEQQRVAGVELRHRAEHRHGARQPAAQHHGQVHPRTLGHGRKHQRGSDRDHQRDRQRDDVKAPPPQIGRPGQGLEAAGRAQPVRTQAVDHAHGQQPGEGDPVRCVAKRRCRDEGADHPDGPGIPHRLVDGEMQHADIDAGLAHAGRRAGRRRGRFGAHGGDEDYSFKP